MTSSLNTCLTHRLRRRRFRRFHLCHAGPQIGAQKSSDVPPKRPYRKKMVVHSPPAKRDGEAGAGVGTGAGAGAGDASGTAHEAMSNSALLGDLLQQDDVAAVTTVHDFGLWEGNKPPDRTPVIDDVKINDEADPKLEDADRISVASSPEARPPPHAGNLPPLNPFTPEWFEKIINAAATTAATAAATAAIAGSSRPPAASTPSPVDSSAPRRLNDRKVPDFWEDRPEFWFRIFDAHLAHFNPTETRSFDALLPLSLIHI